MAKIEIGKGLKGRVRKLVEFLDSLSEDEYVNAGDIEIYLKGGFGDSSPEDEIQILSQMCPDAYNVLLQKEGERLDSLF